MDHDSDLIQYIETDSTLISIKYKNRKQEIRLERQEHHAAAGVCFKGLDGLQALCGVEAAVEEHRPSKCSTLIFLIVFY